jgi:hypothetical protein
LAALKTLVSWLSYLFHLLLALFLLGLAILGLASGPQSLHLEMLPWSGATLNYFLLAGALFGLFSIVLAIMGRLRFLFLLWGLAVAVLLTKGYIFSSYRFGVGGWHNAAYLIAAAWVAVAGAWFQLFPARTRPDRGPRRYRVK